jgi:GT2 family glycosyltransferase
MRNITASIVLYNTPSEMYLPAIHDFLQKAQDRIIYVVDNSDAMPASRVPADPRIHYIATGRNLGFGKAHNLAIRRARGESDVHFIVNPDVRILNDAVCILSDLLQGDPGIGLAMPNIVYPDGSEQNLCKLLPTPMTLIGRRFVPFASMRDAIDRRYVISGLSDQHAHDIPMLSGCFLAARTELLNQIGGFDERFFLYMEDFDLVRRVSATHRTLYEPRARISHGYQRGSIKNAKLLRLHVRSAIQYFNKWGWFIDAQRKKANAPFLDRS